jgi:hypothetical protein
VSARLLNVGALRELIARERARLGPLSAGGTIAVPLDDLERVCDELDFARQATGELAELAGDAVATLAVAVGPKTIDAERARLRTKILPDLVNRLPGRVRPEQYAEAAAKDPAAQRVAEIVTEALEASGVEPSRGRDQA